MWGLRAFREEHDRMEEQRRQLDAEIERVLVERQKMVELQEVGDPTVPLSDLTLCRHLFCSVLGWGVSFVFALPVIWLCSVAILYDSNSNDINLVMVLYSLCNCKEREQKKSSQCCII